MPHMMALPAKPPKMALKSKAERKMLPKTAPKLLMFSTITTRETTMYSTPMSGTSTSVTFVSRLAPPRTDAANSTASTAPTTIDVVLP